MPAQYLESPRVDVNLGKCPARVCKVISEWLQEWPANDSHLYFPATSESFCMSGVDYQLPQTLKAAA